MRLQNLFQAVALHVIQKCHDSFKDVKLANISLANFIKVKCYQTYFSIFGGDDLSLFAQHTLIYLTFMMKDSFHGVKITF